MQKIHQGISRFAYKERLWSEAPRIVCFMPGYLDGAHDNVWYPLRNSIMKRNVFKPFQLYYDRRDTLDDATKDSIAYANFIMKGFITGVPINPTIDVMANGIGYLLLRASQTTNPQFWKENTFGKLTLVSPMQQNCSLTSRFLASKRDRKWVLGWGEMRHPWSKDLGQTWHGQPSLAVELENTTQEMIDQRFAPMDVSMFESVLIVNRQNSDVIEEPKFEMHHDVRHEFLPCKHDFMLWNLDVLNMVADYNTLDKFETNQVDPATIKPGKVYGTVWPPKRASQYEPPPFYRLPHKPGGPQNTGFAAERPMTS